jgi:hypothetical protein
MRTDRLRSAISARLSPEGTRRATTLERWTVGRLGWDQLVRWNRLLEILGRMTTVLWVAFFASLVLGVDWRDGLETLVNSGRPVRAAVILVVVIPTLLFVAARSLIGFARWRVQRELWRREVSSLPRETMRP